MKAILDIALRSVILEYSIKVENKNNIPYSERTNEWEMFQKSINSKTIQCKQTIYFKDVDEWNSVTLLDGTIVDVHFDYEPRVNFLTKKEWLSYVIQAYPYVAGDEQKYDMQLIDRVQILPL